MDKETVRWACRYRQPLDGIDAQALEHALTQAESENNRLRKENGELKEALFFSECEVKQSEETEKRLMKERSEWQERAVRATNTLIKYVVGSPR